MTDFQSLITDLPTIAHYMVSFEGVLTFCSFLILVALAFYIALKLRIRPITKNLKVALKKLKEMPPSAGFINAYKNFDDFVSSNPILQHNWAEYRKNFIFPKATDKNKIICNTEEAVCYFSEESIIAGRVNLRFYGSFPNYLTGTGILGTFLGLVAGIYLASAGLASEDTQLLKKSLQDLLSCASLAFWTSIAGIVCSILFSWREKALTHGLFRTIDNWNRELDKRIEKITPEELANKQLDQLVRQTEFLEEFTTKVAYNIAEALDDRLNEKLVPTLNKLTESVDLMRRDRGDTNEQLIKQMVQKFSDSVQGAAGNEIRAIADTLNTLNEALVPLLNEVKEAQSQMQGAALYIADQIKTSYENSGKEFSEGVQAAIGELRSGISEAGYSLNDELKDAFNQAVDRLNTVVEKLDEGIGNLGNTGKNTEQLIIESQGLLNQFKSMAGDLSSIQANMQDSIIALKGAAGAMENAGDVARENLSHSVRMLDEFQTAASEFRKVQEDLRQVWSDYSVRFEEVDDSLENIFSQIEEGLSAYAEATSKYMGDLDNQATKVTELFSGAVRDLGEAVEDLSEVFTN